jgi:hypothetical protein
MQGDFNFEDYDYDYDEEGSQDPLQYIPTPQNSLYRKRAGSVMGEVPERSPAKRGHM